MSEQAASREVCEHYWSWVTVAGTRHFAHLCRLCHDPDPVWLNEVHAPWWKRLFR